MPRSLWNGTISFGLLTVPIKVYSAINERGVHFHHVHAKDGARVRHERICSREGAEVPYDQVVKGYELRDGAFVVLDQREIDATAEQPSHRIELEEFVCESDIDPIFYDRTYRLGAGPDGHRAYRLLHDAARAGVGRWLFHNREYLAAVRPFDGVLALQTMRFAYQLVPPRRLGIPDPTRAPTRREIEMGQALVDTLQGPFDPSAYHATYRERLLELIRRRARGEALDLAEAQEPAPTPDLLAALEASLAATGRKSAGASRAPIVGRRRRGSRVPAAQRGDAPGRSSRGRAVRDAGEGPPGHSAGADPDPQHDAVRGRSAFPRRDRNGDAGITSADAQAARSGGGGDRGALGGVGSREHKDRYRVRLRRVVDRKRQGHTVRVPAARDRGEGACRI